MGKLITAILTVVIWLAIVIVCFAGYLSNITALLAHTGFGLLEVVRILGIFVVPLGVIMGFI